MLLIEHTIMYYELVGLWPFVQYNLRLSISLAIIFISLNHKNTVLYRTNQKRRNEIHSEQLPYI